MKKKRSESSALAERIRRRRAATPTKHDVRFVSFPPEEMAIDAADVDASKAPAIGRARKDWHKFLSFKRGFVKLDPDIREAFPDNAAVNEALRKVIELQNMKPRARRRKSA